MNFLKIKKLYYFNTIFHKMFIYLFDSYEAIKLKNMCTAVYTVYFIHSMI